MRVLVSALMLFSSPSFAGEPAAASSATRKLAIVPFATLGPGVPLRTGSKAAAMLGAEFNRSQAVLLLDIPKAQGGGDPSSDGLSAARKGVEEARSLRLQRKFRLAEQALVKAMASYRRLAPAVTQIAEVIDGYALWSAIQYNTGRDEEGFQSLSTALALSPDRELPLAATSPLFFEVVAQTRKRVKASANNRLTVDSSPAGGTVFVDGVVLGSTPLRIKDVPAGLHFWKVAFANSETVGGVVEVVNGQPTQVTATSTAKDSQSRMLALLGQNKVDAELATAAKEQAAALRADLLLFGALSRVENGLALDAFLYVAAANEIQRLPRTRFDVELLSAGVELYNLAGGVSNKSPTGVDRVQIPSKVILGLAKNDSRVNEAEYGASLEKDVASKGTEPAEPGKDADHSPTADTKVRVPLKKK